MGENQSPEPSAHHFAPNLGKHPFPISRRGTPTSDLRGPEGPRAEREKLTRASPSRAREVYSRQWPSVLAPPPALAYEEEVPNATAAREQQPKPPLSTAFSYQPGRGRGLAGGFTSSHGDLASLPAPTQLGKLGDPLSRQPSRLRRTARWEM